MTIQRETIALALFNLGASLSWGDGRGFADSGRRVRAPDQIPAWPALYQSQFEEESTQRTGMDAISLRRFAWFIFHETGDPDQVLDSETNAILDAIDPLFDPGDWAPPQTLGGLVHKAWQDGKIEIYGGALTGRSLIVVPISIIVP